MRIISAFALLAVLGGLAVFLTFSSSWGALLAPQVKAEPTALLEETATATPDWTGKLTANISQAVVLRAAPVPSAPVVGMLRRGDTVALVGCDTDVLWCQTEDESWLLAYMVDALPTDLPILEHPGLTVANAKAALTPTPEPFIPPPATSIPTAQALALLLPTPTPAPTYIEVIVNDAANLRAGPGTDFAIVGKAASGATVQITGQSEDGEWYKLADSAWIAAFLVEPPLAPPPIVAPDTPAPAADVSQLEVPVLDEIKAPAIAAPETTSGEESSPEMGEATASS